MTGLKFIICTILSAILVIGSYIKTTSAQIRRDKISFSETFSRNMIYNSNNPQLTKLDSALYSISEYSKRDRIRVSYIVIGIGVPITFQGLRLLNDPAEFAALAGVLLLVMGVPMIAAGMYGRVNPSKIEKYYMEFRDIPEATPDEAERKLIAGELRFEKFARSMKRMRYITSGMVIAFGISYISEGSEEALLGVSAVGMGTWRFISKSSLEKAYDRYIEKKEIYSSADVGSNLSWNIFPLTEKGIGGALSLDF